jgi:hypothetical protein
VGCARASLDRAAAQQRHPGTVAQLLREFMHFYGWVFPYHLHAIMTMIRDLD